MQSANLLNKEKVEVIIVKGGCCSLTSGSNSVIEKSKTLLTQVGSELNIDIAVKEITFSEALSGPYLEELKTKGWEAFSRGGMSSVPMLIVDGKIISTGAPDKGTIINALQNRN